LAPLKKNIGWEKTALIFTSVVLSTQYLHLLYARFWHKVLFDLGFVTTNEPFGKLFNQGYIQAYSYQDERGMYVDATKIKESSPGKFEFDGKPVTRNLGKMGKSLKNSISPDEVIRNLWLRYIPIVRNVFGTARTIQNLGHGSHCWRESIFATCMEKFNFENGNDLLIDSKTQKVNLKIYCIKPLPM
jgi:hypothetical protein